jgi:hypothetical protein
MNKMIFKKGAAIFTAAVALVFVGTALFERDTYGKPEEKATQSQTFDMSQIKTVVLESTGYANFDVVYSAAAQSEAKVILPAGNSAGVEAGVLHIRLNDPHGSAKVTLPFQANILQLKNGDGDGDGGSVTLSSRGGAMPTLHVDAQRASTLRFLDYVGGALTVTSLNKDVFVSLAFDDGVELEQLNVALAKGRLYLGAEGYTKRYDNNNASASKPFVVKQGTLQLGRSIEFSTSRPSVIKNLTFEPLP